MNFSQKFPPQAESVLVFDLFAAGRYAELEARTRKLVEDFPEAGLFWKALGAAIQMQGREEEALSALHLAVELLPDDAPAQCNLGRALQHTGQADAAKARFLRALEINPDFADAHNNLGSVLDGYGQHQEAAASYRRALKNQPDFAEAHANLGGALRSMGQLEDAAASFRMALQIKPEYVQAHNRLGVVLRSLGHVEEAEACHRRALEIDPDHASAHNNLGVTLQDLGRFDAAMASCRRALEIDPDFASAHINLGCALEALWRLEDAVASFRRALEIDPDSIAVRSSLLSLQHYIAGNSPVDLLTEARQFGDLVVRQARPFMEWKNIPDGERCVRVGLMSPDFHHHPVGHFLEGIVAALAAKAAGRLAIVGYTTNTHSDEVTERIKACCVAWHSASGMSDESLARQIRDDGIDILIDLSGHTVHNRLPLFAWKPAPVQISWLGYFATTGVAAIDYLIADPWTLPASEEAYFTEKIWRLPETRLCFTVPDVDIDVAPLPALATGQVTFGSFQNPNKIGDAVVALWAKVLQAVPGSRMLLKTKQLDTAEIRQRVTERFAAHDIGADRLILEGFSSRAGYLATYQRVDIVLDTFPFPGGTTTVESLWMGVPVLTLAGSSFLARQGLGLLMNAGLPEWIATDADEYVARAVAHAGDLPRLAALRGGLRQQVLASPLFDAPRFAGHFEVALRGMWHAWCARQPAVRCRPVPHDEVDRLVAMFNAGRHAELEARTVVLTDRDPDLGLAWKLLGAAQQVQGKDALPALQKAVELLPGDAEVHNNIGVALANSGQLDAARASFERTLGIDADCVVALRSLAVILSQHGQLAEAATTLRHLLTIHPEDADTHGFLGNVLSDLGELDAAVASYRRALALRPDLVEAHSNLGVALHQLGKFDEAVASYRQALAIAPDFAGAHTNLGVSLVSLGSFDEAVACHLRAVAIDAGNPRAHYNLGIALQAHGRFDQAVAAFRQALAINPEAADAHLSLGDALNELGQPANALASYRRALEIRPDLLDAQSNLLFTQNYLANQDPKTMLADARRYGDIVGRHAHPFTEWQNFPDGERGLRVGLVSGDLRDHPVGHFIEGVLSELAVNFPQRLDFIAYSNHPLSDLLTVRIKASFAAWHCVVGMSDESLARQIRADGIDILIDLSGHTGLSRLPLFAWKPAPVQISWLGYFATTGVAAIDYLIADPWTLPEAEEAQFTEKIWRLPETRLCFTVPDVDIDVAPLPALATGQITFGSFQNPNKIGDAVVALWARVLQAVPGSRLLLKTKQLDTAEIRQRVTERFAAHGINADLLILEGFSSRAGYLATYGRVDIVLDTFPFPGGTTTVESLWMGVPVLTLAGSSFLARQGLGLLMNAGLPEWIAADADDYVARAVAHAGDLPRLAALRGGLRQQVLASPLFDAPRFAGHFEVALRGMWHAWCARQPAVRCRPVPHDEVDRLVAMFNAGRHAELEARTVVLTDRDPDLGLAWKLLGAAQQVQGKDALPALQKAVELLPGDAEVLNNLGVALIGRGEIQAAATCFRQALEEAPDNASAHNGLGGALVILGQLDDAVSSLRRAIQIDPGFVRAHCNLGAALQALGHLDEAVASYRQALAINPSDADTHNNLGVALKDLGRLDEAVASYRRALTLKPDDVEAFSNLLFCENYLSKEAASVFARAQDFGRLVAGKARPCASWQNSRDPDRRLRVGLVSGDLRTHTVGRFVDGVLAALFLMASDRLELIGYPTYHVADVVTRRIKSCCHGWHSVVGLSDEQFSRLVRDDGIDILIDLSGHTAHNRLPLFAWKPAPVQVSWLGYFATSGVAAMDFLIADPWTLPEAEEVYFTEKIWRLPETRLCFTPPEEDIGVAPLPALTNHHVTFGCFNNLTKINDEVVALWARILNAVEGSRLLLKARQLDGDSTRAAIVERFHVKGIGADRLILEGASPRSDYLAAYRRIDIAFDPFPYPGGATTVESLWMGVPVLTLAGSSFLARQGLGLLMNAGLPEWIAADADDYVARAVAHAGDLPRLAALRGGLRQQVLASPLFDAPRFAGHFEEALRGMWRAWCAQQDEVDQLVALFNAGRHAELEARAAMLTDRDPKLGMAWKLLGAAQQVQGKEALTALQRATALLPGDAEAHNDLGSALEGSGQIDDAAASFRRALEIVPDFAEAHCNLGNVFLKMGQAARAVASLRRAVEIKPDFAEAYNSLGIGLQALGKPDDAVASYRLALGIKPDFAKAHNNLGITLLSLGQTDDALSCYRRALELNPKFANAHNNLGVALQSLGQLDEAASSYRRALEINPGFDKAYSNLGGILRVLGQLSEAEATCRRAIEINAKNPEAHLNLGNVMRDLGRIDSAVESYSHALKIDPCYGDAHCNLLFTHNYLADRSAEKLLTQARRFGEIARQRASLHADWPNSPVPDRLLRVGLVSGDLREHPVGHFIEAVLSALAVNFAQRLSFIAYANHPLSDPLTERIKGCCLLWRSVVGVSDERLARQIRDDGIDILIDLSGHTVHNRLPLFAWKPAPVQISWLGYFATTGVAAIDYLIADPWTLPASEEAYFTEKIWRLPETRLCFTAPDMDIGVAPLPALKNGHITFAGFHNLYKINDAVVALWAKVLQAVPGSRMVLKTKQLDTAEIRQRVTERFAAHGIGADRLILEGFSSRAGYLATYQRVDIVLDTFPFPGGTTTVESLWMGVPVLTLAGSSFLARQGLGLLMNAGLPEWIAADADDYVARAVAHAGDLPRLAALRGGLRQQVLASPLFDAPRFAGHFEEALRGMWRAWCGKQSGVMRQLNETQSMKTFLHVGCGANPKAQTTRGFNSQDWKEVRLDIDPKVNPDIVGTMLDMSAVADGSVDALFSGHNIEHLYAHEVLLALAEFRRVLKPDGFVVITCPDLQSVCQLIAEDKLVEPAYNSPAGPISPLDILYGLRSSLEQGNHYMAHRCGFTEKVLVGTLQDAGFGSVISGRRTHPYYDLWAVASKGVLSEDLLGDLAEAHFPEDDETEPAALPQADESPSGQIFSFSSHTYWGVSDRERFSALLEEAKSLVALGYFLGDNLFTWARNNSMLDDSAFVQAWQSNIQNDADEAIVWRRYILACAAYHCLHLQGDFVECGVYSGTGIKTVMDYLGGTAFPKTFWGYDTYDYHPVAGHEFPGQQEGFFEIVRQRFAAYPQVKLIKGLLPDSFASGIPEAVAYLHIDLNNAAGELATLDRLFDRVVPGGIIILDDYEWAGVYRQQKQAEDPWFAARNYRVFPLPTGQGLLIKR